MRVALEVNTDPAKSALDAVQRSIRRGVFLYDEAQREVDARRGRSTNEVYDVESLEGVPFCSEPVELSSGYTATLRPIPDSSGTVTHEQVERQRVGFEVIAGALSLRRSRTVVPLSTLTGLMFEPDWLARREVVREPS